MITADLLDGRTARRTCLNASLVASLFAAGGLAAAAERQPRPDRAESNGDFHASAVIRKDGSVEIGEIFGVAAPLAAAVRDQTAALKFQPARRDNTPVDSAAHISGVVVLKPVDEEEYSVSVNGVSVSPYLTHLKLPAYPTEQCRTGKSGGVEVALGIDASGSVESIDIISAEHRDFVSSVEKAVAQWRFAPMPHIEQPMVLKVPFWFHPMGKDLTPAPFQCTTESSQPRVEGQSGCMDYVEINCSRIKRI